MGDCIFCRIVEGSAEAYVVDEDEHTLAFLDIMPLTRGHTLVIPKSHTDDFWSVDEPTAVRVMRAAHRVAARLEEVLRPEGLNLLQATRTAGFQSVFHFHLHVIPRWTSDTMSFPPWPQPAADPGELTDLAAELGRGAG